MRACASLSPLLVAPTSHYRVRTPRCSAARRAVRDMHPDLRLRTPSPPGTSSRASPGDGDVVTAADEEGQHAVAPFNQASSRAVQRDLARRLHGEWLAVADTPSNAKPISPAYGGEDFLRESRVRATWLLGLLVLQSLSSFVLEANEALIREHLVVTLFLTMLVGAGGNSGAQSSVHVIRGLATGQFSCSLEAFTAVLQQQLRVGVLLGTALAAGGYCRVYLTEGIPLDAFAIACSLFMIVNVSVLVGTSLPFALAWRGVDPAHAGTTVQVIMDVAGVALTCAVCRIMLTSAAGPGAEAEAAIKLASVAAGDLIP
jgi:cation transporter-like permease